MKYKSRLRKDIKGYFEYLDDQRRSHILLNEKIINMLQKENVKIDKWYDIIVNEDNKGVKNICLVK